MNDFLIHFAPDADAAALAGLLRGRHAALSRHPVHTFNFPWGAVALMPPAGPGYAPLRGDDVPSPAAGVLAACVGRPRFVGIEHERRGPDGFNALFLERLRSSGPKAVSDELTGMFAAFECGAGRVAVLTDQMGFMPVYLGADRSGRVIAVGTHLDSVAALAGRAADYDPVALGDLLVNQCVTFPYTTRFGVTQLEPAAFTEFPVGADGGVRPADVRTTILWEPNEPAAATSQPPADLEAELEAGLRQAAEDVGRGVPRLAVTLSGGLDSRLVLALMSRRVGAEGGAGGAPSGVAGAITFATRDNREVEVARRVARAAGVRHHIARRGEEFYAELMPRAVELLGTELRGECHGFCVVDNGLENEYDLVVGGFLSDTLFKGHYMPEPMRRRLRPPSPLRRARQTAGTLLRAVGVLPPVRRQPHFWEQARAMETSLTPELRESVRQRREARLARVRRVRPESAEEWARFWPASRGDGAYGPQANTRLFTCDELFFHRRLVELAAKVPASERVGGRLTKRVYPRLYGGLGHIENAATGLPADADPQAARRRNGQPARAAAPVPDPSRRPWNDVPHSWVDWDLLQRLSPTWNGYRAALAGSPALEVLDGVLAGGAADFVRQYRDEAGFLFNRTAVQLAYAIDRTLRAARPGPGPGTLGAAGASPAAGPPGSAQQRLVRT